MDEDEDGSHDGPEQDTWTEGERKKKPGRKAQPRTSVKSDSQTSRVIEVSLARRGDWHGLLKSLLFCLSHFLQELTLPLAF